MTDHQRGMDMSNAMIEAACSATILGEDEQGRPVHLSPEEARTAITAAISAYLATTEPGKPESGVLAVKVKVPVRFLFDRTDPITGEISEDISKVDRSGEPGITNIRPLYGDENV